MRQIFTFVIITLCYHSSPAWNDPPTASINKPHYIPVVVEDLFLVCINKDVHLDKLSYEDIQKGRTRRWTNKLKNTKDNLLQGRRNVTEAHKRGFASLVRCCPLCFLNHVL